MNLNTLSQANELQARMKALHLLMLRFSDIEKESDILMNIEIIAGDQHSKASNLNFTSQNNLKFATLGEEDSAEIYHYLELMIGKLEQEFLHLD
jgi:hypothetical protein